MSSLPALFVVLCLSQSQYKASKLPAYDGEAQSRHLVSGTARRHLLTTAFSKNLTLLTTRTENIYLRVTCEFDTDVDIQKCAHKQRCKHTAKLKYTTQILAMIWLASIQRLLVHTLYCVCMFSKWYTV